MRVHENGFVKSINHTHVLYSECPPEKSATIAVPEFPVALFRWAWLNFIARQKRRYWSWCVFCGPHLGQSRRQIVIDVCHGINALKRTVTHPPSEVRGCCVVEFFFTFLVGPCALWVAFCARSCLPTIPTSNRSSLCAFLLFSSVSR